MLSRSELNVLEEQSYSHTQEDVVDLQNIVIDNTLPLEERFMMYLSVVKNPYVCKCGNIKMKIRFSSAQLTLEDCLAQYLKGI